MEPVIYHSTGKANGERACLTLWAYEFLFNISSELILVWKTAWNIPKVLYLLTRYLPLLTLILSIYYNQTDFSSQCSKHQKILTWGVNVSICISEMIFAIRTWAVWHRTRKLAVLLSLFFLVVWIPSFLIVALWSGDREVPAIFIQPNPFFYRCYAFGANPLRYSNIILMVGFYTVTLSLTLFRAYRYFIKSAGSTSFMRAVHLDGIAYYLFAFSASVMILIIAFASSSMFASTLSRIQLIICTTLACRLLLHLREQGRRAVRGSSLDNSSGFTMSLEPLDFGFADRELGSQCDATSDGGRGIADDQQ